MKATQNTLDSLSDIHRVEHSGHIRRIGGQMLLALARKEIPAYDIEAAAKMIAAQALHMQVEAKVAMLTAMLREKSIELGRVPKFGQRRIDKDDDEEEMATA